MICCMHDEEFGLADKREVEAKLICELFCQ